MICRAMCDLFHSPQLQGKIAFRGGKAINKLLRALLQRDKHRDLFDLNEGLLQLGLDCDKLISCFHHSLAQDGRPISRANAEERMLKKLNRSLTEDIAPLLPTGVSFDDDAAIAAFGRVWGELIARIPGESWKSSKTVIEAIRNSKIPSLLDGVIK